jgi:hypothetical protein
MLPSAAVIIGFRVADFDAWKAVFDANEQDRIDNAILGHHINRAEGEPSLDSTDPAWRLRFWRGWEGPPTRAQSGSEGSRGPLGV